MMKRQRGALAALILAGGMVPVSGAVAAESATITIPVTINTQPKTCSVAIRGNNVGGDTYRFEGDLQKGLGLKQEHPPFQVVISCNEQARRVALVVQSVGGHASGNEFGLYSGSMKSGDLWLVDRWSNKPVPIGGWFCDSVSVSAGKTCELKPVTSILASAPGGPVSTRVRFSVAYP